MNNELFSKSDSSVIVTIIKNYNVKSLLLKK